jgi:hypothetical protein
MRNRYGRAMYGLAATVAVAAMLGLTAAGVATASTHSAKPAITPACTYGNYCSSQLFNVQFGIQYFENDENAIWRQGNPINLDWANDNNPGEDWRVTVQDSVYDLYHLGFLSSSMMVRWRNYWAFEVMWVPYGVETNLCRGLAKNAYPGETVTLQPCGSFPRSLWIVGENYTPAEYAKARPDVPQPYYGGNVILSASANNPSTPLLMTAGGGLFGFNPFSAIVMEEQNADDGVVNESQLWCTAAVGQTYFTPTPSPSGTVSPPTVAPPTERANNPCFGRVRIGLGGGMGPTPTPTTTLAATIK